MVKTGKAALAGTNDKPPAKEVAYPDQEHLKDESGLKRQAKKRKKLHQAAGRNAEDEDAPETANSMLELKASRGEDGWDFDQGEQFSDDEQDNFEFDDQLDTVKEEDGAVSADEEAAEGPDEAR